LALVFCNRFSTFAFPVIRVVFIVISRVPSPSKSARQTALLLLVQLESRGQGTDLGALLDQNLTRSSLSKEDRALLHELVFGVVRQRGYLDWQIDQLSKVPRLAPAVRNILRLGAYQLLFLDRIPPFAAVSTAVDLAKEASGVAGGRLVNGLLRNLLRRKKTLPLPDPIREPVRHLAVVHSHPEWLIEKWLRQWGEETTVALCLHNNTPPPLTLRVNVLKTTRERLTADLTAEGISSSPTSHAPQGLQVKGVQVTALASFQRGEFYVQDEGAQMVSLLVAPKPGESILDFCAAPGGKTFHLAELVHGRGNITATDVDAARLTKLRENLRRLQTPGVVVLPAPDALREQYDAIVVDAPCSALGILRRIPEGKWNKSPNSITASVKVQYRILEQVAPRLKIGGRLIYITCSTEPEENEGVVARFSAAHPEMRLDPLADLLPQYLALFVTPSGTFTTFPNSDNMDHFFAVRWRKG
jgi:16S rRNA (cytosine967-C5)-methyltransferase